MNNELTRAVVRVGDGRGFVVNGEIDRLVITAAHCLPFFPPCMSMSFTEERTYKALLGPLGETPTVWTECVFVDPIADIAVLGPPDNQTYFDQYDDYCRFVEAAATLPIAPAPKKGGAWVLLLDREWRQCTTEHWGGPLGLSIAIQGGMSGSPIIADCGSAIGVVVCGDNDRPADMGQPNLVYHLPKRFLDHAKVI